MLVSLLEKSLSGTTACPDCGRQLWEPDKQFFRCTYCKVLVNVLGKAITDNEYLKTKKNEPKQT